MYLRPNRGGRASSVCAVAYAPEIIVFYTYVCVCAVFIGRATFGGRRTWPDRTGTGLNRARPLANRGRTARPPDGRPSSSTPPALSPARRSHPPSPTVAPRRPFVHARALYDIKAHTQTAHKNVYSFTLTCTYGMSTLPRTVGVCGPSSGGARSPGTRHRPRSSYATRAHGVFVKRTRRYDGRTSLTRPNCFGWTRTVNRSPRRHPFGLWSNF